MTKKGLILDLLVNGVLPWAGYLFLQKQYGLSDYHALLAVTVIPALFALVGILKKGRPDLVASITLGALTLSLIMTALTTDAVALQIRESFFTLLMGVLFLGSSAFGKPFLWLIAIHQADTEERRVALQQAERKKMLGTINAVWGASFIAEFLIKIWMIQNLPVADVLALSPVMFYGMTGITVLWTLWWARRRAAALGIVVANTSSPR